MTITSMTVELELEVVAGTLLGVVWVWVSSLPAPSLVSFENASGEAALSPAGPPPPAACWALAFASAS